MSDNDSPPEPEQAQPPSNQTEPVKADRGKTEPGEPEFPKVKFLLETYNAEFREEPPDTPQADADNDDGD